MGIADIPLCRPFDFLCQIARKAAKAAVYSTWAQENLIQVSVDGGGGLTVINFHVLQAQYYRDPSNFETYLHANHFLPYINNEIEEARNQTYARNFASLSNLVLVMFTEDKMVVPKESSWFGYEEIQDRFVSGASDQQRLSASDKRMVPMREQPLYVEDWIGLRELDERGAVVFAECAGEHMEMEGCWEELIVEYTGGNM
jgi:palmitoyl-protein thioesterase